MFLERDEIMFLDLAKLTDSFYRVRNPNKALLRDLFYLLSINAIVARDLPDNGGTRLAINLEWPAQITETEFFKKSKELPKSKVHPFLSR